MGSFTPVADEVLFGHLTAWAVTSLAADEVLYGHLAAWAALLMANDTEHTADFPEVPGGYDTALHSREQLDRHLGEPDGD